MDTFTYLVSAGGMLLLGVWLALVAYRSGRDHRAAEAKRDREAARMRRDMAAWERRIRDARQQPGSYVDPVALKISMDMPEHLVNPEKPS